MGKTSIFKVLEMQESADIGYEKQRLQFFEKLCDFPEIGELIVKKFHERVIR